MNFFTFIFSLYILLLSAGSCCAADTCGDELQHTTQKSKQEQGGGCTNCSPFNQCGNCAGFTLSYTTLQWRTPPPAAPQFFSRYIQWHIPGYHASFWQPPRLG